jgi:hypothetical protein
MAVDISMAMIFSRGINNAYSEENKPKGGMNI